jgi:hypothetical protein
MAWSDAARKAAAEARRRNNAGKSQREKNLAAGRKRTAAYIKNIDSHFASRRGKNQFKGVSRITPGS